MAAAMATSTAPFILSIPRSLIWILKSIIQLHPLLYLINLLLLQANNINKSNPKMQTHLREQTWTKLLKKPRLDVQNFLFLLASVPFCSVPNKRSKWSLVKPSRAVHEVQSRRGSCLLRLPDRDCEGPTWVSFWFLRPSLISEKKSPSSSLISVCVCVCA